MEERIITFVAAAYKETVDAYQFISCLLLQTDPRWKCIIYNDGENPYVKEVVEKFNDERIKFVNTPEPTKFWGHYNRIDALNNQITIQTYVGGPLNNQIITVDVLIDYDITCKQ